MDVLYFNLNIIYLIYILDEQDFVSKRHIKNPRKCSNVLFNLILKQAISRRNYYIQITYAGINIFILSQATIYMSPVCLNIYLEHPNCLNLF